MEVGERLQRIDLLEAVERKIVHQGERVERADLEAWVDACAAEVGSYECVLEMLAEVTEEEGPHVAAVGRTAREHAVALLGLVRQPFRRHEVPQPFRRIQQSAAVHHHGREYTAEV